MDQEIAKEIIQKRLGDTKRCLNTVYDKINECERKGIIDAQNVQEIYEALDGAYRAIQKVVNKAGEMNNKKNGNANL